MNVILLLAPFSVMLGLLAVAGFVWTLRAGQYDDIKGSAMRILIDEPDGDLSVIPVTGEAKTLSDAPVTSPTSQP